VKIGKTALEDGIEVPGYTRFTASPMRQKLRMLAAGKVGQCVTEFAPRKSGHSYIFSMAKGEGIQVIVRREYPEQQHPQKKAWCLFRIWNSGGLDAKALNEQIRQAKQTNL